MEGNYPSDDEEQELNLAEISITKMGETSVKYSSDPCTILGKGLTAIVYPGYHFGINKPAAIKFIQKQYLRVETEQVNELKIWSEIDQNINIVRLYDSYRDPRNGLFLAMEKAERTFTKQIIKHNSSRDVVITWLHQVSKAVEYLHEKAVIHRDIKPDNILMFLQDGNKLVAKLADFGVSKTISGAERTGTFSNACGTLLWMAPEALENKNKRFRNTKMLDIFALGMTIYFGLSKGGHPFSNPDHPDDFTSLVSEMTRPYIFPKKLCIEQRAANSLLKGMMEREPYNRPRISDVLSHCLFWNWEQEHQFLIRAAICISNEDCVTISLMKRQLDLKYYEYYCRLYPGKSFNWINVAKENNLDIPDLLFTSRKRKKPTLEYGSGESVTKFLKLFRDKYVHYPDMKPEGAVVFSDDEGSFCEEMYVKIFTSICPGLSSVLYDELSWYTDVGSLLPLSKIYFKWKLRNNDNNTSLIGRAPGGLRQIMDYDFQLLNMDRNFLNIEDPEGIDERCTFATGARTLPREGTVQGTNVDENLIREYAKSYKNSRRSKRRCDDDVSVIDLFNNHKNKK